MTSDYPFVILDLWLLITPLLSSIFSYFLYKNHCIVNVKKSYIIYFIYLFKDNDWSFILAYK